MSEPIIIEPIIIEPIIIEPLVIELVHTLLLTLHIACGFLALVTSAVAIITPKGKRWHRLSGRLFTYGMAGIFITALLIQFINPNLFLSLIAVFSFYLAMSGWLRAKNRSGIAITTEWSCAFTMLIASVVMVVFGWMLMISDDRMGVVLIVFAFIGGGFAAAELLALRGNAYTGTNRIASHVSRMLGGSISTVTAFAVVNIDLGERNWIVWLAPTVAFVPLIVYWNIRVRSTDKGISTG